MIYWVNGLLQFFSIFPAFPLREISHFAVDYYQQVLTLFCSLILSRLSDIMECLTVSPHFVGCGYSLWTVYYLVSLILCAVLSFCRGAVLLKIRISSFFFFFIVFFNGPIGKGSGDNLLFLFYCLFNECKIQFYLLHGIILMAQYVKKKVKISRLIF